MARTYLALAKRAATIASDKKGIDVVLLNVQRQTTETNYVLIVCAESAPHVNAIRSTIMEMLKNEEKRIPLHHDGRSSATWSILDYGGLLIHILSSKTRHHYAIDRLYDGARALTV